MAAGLHYIQVDPDSDTADLPVIICLHGRGADANDLASLALEVYPEGYRWLLPQGPLPVPLGPRAMGWAWYALGEDRPTTIVKSREQVAHFIDETTKALGVPSERVALMGFSQGAATSLHVALTSPVTFGAVVVMSGYLPAAETVEQLSGYLAPAAGSGDLKTPAPLTPQEILMVHGTQDQTLDVSLARQARDVLVEAGLAPRYFEFPMGHTITAESLDAVRQFLGDVFPPRQAL
jgi:phospholipase/carboxylesterase